MSQERAVRLLQDILDLWGKTDQSFFKTSLKETYDEALRSVDLVRFALLMKKQKETSVEKAKDLEQSMYSVIGTMKRAKVAWRMNYRVDALGQLNRVLATYGYGKHDNMGGSTVTANV